MAIIFCENKVGARPFIHIRLEKYNIYTIYCDEIVTKLLHN